MITPSDLWIAYMAGFAGGTILPLLGILLHMLRARRSEEIKRRYWKTLSMFRG